MALSDKKYTYDKLGEINTSGIEVALFPQIRDAIADRMKEIYGNDIDLSTASADGQYINMESLILNNIYTLLLHLYDNIDPYTASGKYLDILCSLTNVQRKGSSRSTAQVYVKNVSGANQTPVSITLVDRNGIQWNWTNPTDLNSQPIIVLAAGKVTPLTFECDQYGTVQASGTGEIITDPETDIDWDANDFIDTNGFIYQPIDYGTYKVYQALDAIIGNDEETDTSLRRRRAAYLGSNSVTTQAGLEAALYNMEGIDDVYILNNNTGADTIANDGVTVENHNVYIVLRYKTGIDEDAYKPLIADTIYNKLTPGVNTQAYDSDDGQGGSNIEYTVQLFSRISTKLNWKKCTPVNPTIVINFMTTENFTRGTDVTEQYSKYELAIIKQLKNYLNGIKINEELLSSAIQTTMMAADLKYNGITTFYTTSCTIGSNNTNLAPLTYYDYDTYTFTYSGQDNRVGTLTITHS